MGTTQIKILIAEDSLANQMIFLRMLKQFGLSADVVSTGLEALMAVMIYKYDIVFMDDSMPDMDGVEATRLILKSHQVNECPKIIALTANSMINDRERCIDAGMDDYLTRPVRLEEVMSVLNRWVPALVMSEATTISQKTVPHVETARKQYVPHAAPVFRLAHAG